MTTFSLIGCMMRLGCVSACVSVLGGMLGCGHAKLDESFGVRNREIFRVQSSARSGRDVVSHGQEVESAVAKYLQSIAPDTSGGGAKPPGASGGGLMIPSVH